MIPQTDVVNVINGGACMDFSYVYAIGQDSHRFESNNDPEKRNKKLVLGGVDIPGCPGFQANSDGDVVLHALTNAISGITCVNILGDIADDMCKNQGITDSREYLKRALSYLGENKITHVSFSLECKRPILSSHIPLIRNSVAEMIAISPNEIGITATSGEGLSDFGRGDGVMVLCAITVCRPLSSQGEV